MSKPKIYLAGPTVFYPNSKSLAEEMKEICSEFGFEGIYPLDNEINTKGKTKDQIAKEIAEANVKLIKSCDAIIADITPFRGPSSDVGTAFEIGYGVALGLPVIAFNKSKIDNYYDRVKSLSSNKKLKSKGVDNNGHEIENFKQVDNLMITKLISGYSCNGFKGAVLLLKEKMSKS